MLCDTCGFDKPEYAFPYVSGGRPTSGARRKPTCRKCRASLNHATERRCRRCARLLPITAFKPRLHGFKLICLECSAPSEKRCNRCHTVQPIANFTRRKERDDEYSTLCHGCQADGAADKRDRERERWYTHNKAWQQRNRERVSAQKRLRKYGLTLEAFTELLSLQGGACAICGTTETHPKNGWAVDHDHTTGRVRGILCHDCNKALGIMRDDPKRLRRAADYLECA
ncbi:MAG: endonuclease VII domain-containing protein [Acidimicrobiaceae bacterium]|nr:endonuclease VII domain-containing protein [Acidimicrobiaceae bacterium]